MKAVMIIYNQAHSEVIIEILDKCDVRGYTKWVDVQGRGSHKGEPHLGTHAWPSKNMSTLAVISQDLLPNLIKELKELNLSSEKQGLKVFVWDADSVV